MAGVASAPRPGKNSFLVRVLCGAPSAGCRSSAAANAKVTAAQLLLNSREAGQGRSFVRLVMKLSCVATRHQLSNTGKLYSDNLFPAAFFYCCKSRLPNKELSDERNIQSSSYHNIYGRYYATIFLGFADKYPRFLTAGCIKGCTILILPYDMMTQCTPMMPWLDSIV